MVTAVYVECHTYGVKGMSLINWAVCTHAYNKWLCINMIKCSS